MSILQKNFTNSRDNVANILSKKIGSGSSNFSAMFKIQNIHSIVTSWGAVCQKQIEADGEFAKIYAENLLEMISEVEEALQDSLENLS